MKYFEFRIWTSLIGKFALVVVGDLGPILLNYFCRNWTAVKLRQDFDASFYTLNGFASVNLHHQDESVPILSSKQKYVHLKTHWASHTLHQNLAVILWQFDYGKNSFIVLIPTSHSRSIQTLFCCSKHVLLSFSFSSLVLSIFSPHSIVPFFFLTTK